MTEEKGLPVWLVGGCLRDLLLGLAPKDWDFAVALPPQEAEERLKGAGLKVYETGLKHGTLTFRFEKENFELTSLRLDGPYPDHRRPEWVKFTQDIRQDLSRRDFTINAMAYRPGDGLTDPYGGREDLAGGILRAVGEAEKRLEEDALRVLRAVRFAGRFGLRIEPSLASAMRGQAGLLSAISRERIAAELNAMLLEKNPVPALELLADFGLWPYIIPEMAACVGFQQHSVYHHLDVYGHTLLAVANTPPQLELRLAALLHDMAKPAVFTLDAKGKGHFYDHELAGAKMARKALQGLRYSRAVQDKVELLVRFHMLHLKTLKSVTLKRFLRALPKPRQESLEEVLVLQKADLLASRYTKESVAEYEAFAQRSRTVLESGCPLDIADLAIDGRDLVEVGIPENKRSSFLEEMLELVMAYPAMNNRQQLMAIAERRG
ncbi:MAG: CCA tRNA nucleotidyltransferase [Peptococcaceae bacterium]|nr:CCA tRNA nucleotidyltransferase [Peptococcaceae bacterium]